MGEKGEESTSYEVLLYRRLASALESGDGSRRRAVDRALWNAGYEARLSDEVVLQLLGTVQPRCELEKDDDLENGKNEKKKTLYCAVDDAIPSALLDRITSLFASRRLREDYWSAHHYGSVGFFSYSFGVCPRVCDARTSLEQLAHLVLEVVAVHCPQLLCSRDAIEGSGDVDAAADEQTRRACSWRAEMWAHRRRVGLCGGHQLHFDSADEGRGGVIRNPAFSSILFLSDGHDDDGGDDNRHEDSDAKTMPMMSPTLITDMARADEGKLVADTNDGGVLVYPSRGRIVAFRGDLCHGVLPLPIDPRASHTATTMTAAAAGGGGGAAIDEQHRVTVMLAFWREDAEEDQDAEERSSTGDRDAKKRARIEDQSRLETLDISQIRAAMPLPPIPSSTTSTTEHTFEPWTRDLRPASINSTESNSLCSHSSMRRAAFIPIRRVWSHVISDGRPVTQLPPYNAVFQCQ